MRFPGWLAFGGISIVNNALTRALMREDGCAIDRLFHAPPCAALRDPIFGGDVAASETPWYDGSRPDVSSRFFGAYLWDLKGLSDTNRNAQISEGIDDGGDFGSFRRGVRQVRATVSLFGKGRDAIDYGASWLSSALTGTRCAQHGGACGVTDLEYLTECPPERGDAYDCDDWREVARNLFTNPRMLTTESTPPRIEVYRNHDSNPSREAAGATTEMARNALINPRFAGSGNFDVEVRRNRWTDPMFITTATGGPTGGAGATQPPWTIYQRVELTRPRLGLIRVERVQAGGNAGPGTTLVAASPGEVITVSARIEDTNAWGRVRAIGFDSSTNSDVGSQTLGPSATAGEWSSVTITIPPGADRLNFQLQVSSSVGNFATFSSLLIESVSERLPFFSGYESPDPDMLAQWTGAVNASESVLLGESVPGLSASNGRRAIIRSNFAGRPAARVIRIAMDGPDTLEFATTTPASGSPVTGMLSVARDDAGVGLSGSTLVQESGGAWRNLVLMTTAESRAIPVNEWVPLRGVLNVGQSSTRLRSQAPDTLGASFWLSEAALIPGEYSGPWFSGASGTLPSGLVASWVGPVDNSASVLTAVGVPSLPAATGGSVYRSSEVAQRGAFAQRFLADGGPAVIPLTGYSPTSGETHTVLVSARARDRSITVTPSIAGTPQEPVLLPAGQWVDLRLTDVAGSAGATGTNLAADLEADDIIDIDSVVVSRGTYLGAYFDGETSDDVDLLPEWVGDPNESASTLSGLMVRNMAGISGYAIQSSKWARYGGTSLRLIPPYIDNFVGQPAMAAPLIGDALTASTTTLATSYAATLPTVGGGLSAGLYAIDSNAAIISDPRPDATGAVSHRVQYMPGVEDFLPILIGGGLGGGDVFFDGLLVAENYSGEYFDGYTLPGGLDEVAARVSWEGVADESVSILEERDCVPRPQTDDEYEDDVRAHRRFLHEVAVTSGPLERRYSEREGYSIMDMEFTFTAAVPWIFSATRDVTLPITPTTVIQDTPYNLAVRPSAEVAGPAVTVATNYSTNPSLESNATGWSGDAVSIPLADITSGRVDGELAAAGTASYRREFTASGSGTGGTITAYHTVTLPSLPAGSRLSATLWAAALVVSGTPTLGANISFSAQWRNSGGSVIDTTPLGTAPNNGGAASLASIQPPPGATTVRLYAVLSVPSWSAGDTIRLYADAAGVMNP